MSYNHEYYVSHREKYLEATKTLMIMLSPVVPER